MVVSQGDTKPQGIILRVQHIRLEQVLQMKPALGVLHNKASDNGPLFLPLNFLNCLQARDIRKLI